MKKRLLLFALLIGVLFHPVSVLAETPVEDAFTVDSETRVLLSASEDDTVIRVYFGYFMHGFSLEQTIEEIFNDSWYLHRTAYIIASTDADGNRILDYKYVKDGALLVDDPALNEHSNNDLYYFELSSQTFYDLSDDSERILSVLGPDVTARKTVYMHGLPADGMYIYFETNIGNYVYYTEYPGAEEYLFPLETFYDVAESTQAQRSGSGVGTNLAYSNLSPYNLKHYAPTPRKIFFTVLSWGIPCLLIAGIGIWFFVRKRKKT